MVLENTLKIARQMNCGERIGAGDDPPRIQIPIKGSLNAHKKGWEARQPPPEAEHRTETGVGMTPSEWEKRHVDSKINITHINQALLTQTLKSGKAQLALLRKKL